MAKIPARLRSVTYTLSPMRTGVMHGLFKDWASGMAKRVTENAVDVGLFCALPTIATVMYASNYKEQEKLHHRY
ncbi:Cytochrome b-c1 complex subunit 8, plants [Ostreococcus tauri]|uniref:Cytochrome b-c1 complex subunit 8 n=1 Tax=Ostreococcus tauri TaxID=70448 RepID=A0A090MCP9_OSTTA|nr:Cytochrome b-c1 complex subunit 8, plants [Ostreococcus tauri]OUS43046.1 cytochrome b-c1 complex subunit 8 [Ostreococcus tauri]CEF99844.1 Cytochrome b-c1 complex subunit 8, plants [Ostreococcus tauri]|eukprot:XP_022840069.1 Cytochrome b-c1 complex subunit 8, plants [Ostreococcus tauri]